MLLEQGGSLNSGTKYETFIQGMMQMAKTRVQRCTKCGKDKRLTEFYMSDSVAYKNTRRVPICKVCLRSLIKTTDAEDVFRMIDKPYIASLWKDCIIEYDNLSKALSHYMRQINSLPQYKHMTFAHSTWDADLTNIEEEINSGDGEDNSSYSIDNLSRKELAKLEDKWGMGYSTEEYICFEKKWDNLKGNYSIKTTLHEEALKPYIRFRVKEELATAKGEIKEAKDWASMAKDAAVAAKINPNQLNPHDLSQGLDTMSNIAKMVEENVDFVPILTKNLERPQDKGDFVLWCLVNYLRQTKGMPLCEYEDMYLFYEERKKEYEEREARLMADDNVFNEDMPDGDV